VRGEPSQPVEHGLAFLFGKAVEERRDAGRFGIGQAPQQGKSGGGLFGEFATYFRRDARTHLFRHSDLPPRREGLQS